MSTYKIDSWLNEDTTKFERRNGNKDFGKKISISRLRRILGREHLGNKETINV